MPAMGRVASKETPRCVGALFSGHGVVFTDVVCAFGIIKYQKHLDNDKVESFLSVRQSHDRTACSLLILWPPRIYKEIPH